MDGVILAAGKGERLRPLTGWLPKFMVPLAGVPVVIHVMHRLALQGCKRVVLVVSSEGAEFIRPLRQFVPKMPLEVVLCDQPGQMAALRRGFALTDSPGVWVAFCDNVFDPNKVIDASSGRPFFVSVEDPRLAATKRYGVVSDNGGHRISKENVGTRVQTGLFYLSRAIVNVRGPDDLASIVAAMPTIREHVFESWWRDVGEWDMHLEAEHLLREAAQVQVKSNGQPTQEPHA
jgi:NDP-sugar pyrophosphorylase family protein